MLDHLGFERDAVSPWRLADALGVSVQLGAPGTRPHVVAWRASGWAVVLDPAERKERQAAALLHELAHLVNQRAGLEYRGLRHAERERLAWWTGLSLLWPRAFFGRVRRAVGGRLEEVAPAHPWSSHEAAMRRLTMIEPARVWVWDVEGPKTRRYAVDSPGLRWPSRRPMAVESEAMEAARQQAGACEPIGGVRAWAVADPPWLRVVCVSDAEAVAGY